jgi:hypothetical protein
LRLSVSSRGDQKLPNRPSATGVKSPKGIKEHIPTHERLAELHSYALRDSLSRRQTIAAVKQQWSVLSLSGGHASRRRRRHVE